MKNNITGKVPRYFEPYVNDCFHNCYAAVLQYMGLNPDIILADYLSFMYDQANDNIGVNYLYRLNTSVEFSEEELNTSLEFVYLPATVNFSSDLRDLNGIKCKNKVNINMYVEDDPNVAYSRLKELIDNGKPVITAVDLYYMRYHRAYMKEHGIHCVVITGYDEENNCFELFDKFRLSSSDFDGTLPMDEVNQGRVSDNPLPWGEMNKRPIRNLWMEICVDEAFSIDDDKLINVLKESYTRMAGKRNILGYKCGLDMLEAFEKDLMLKKEDKLDLTNIDWTRVYWYRAYLNISFKNIARNRKRFMVFVKEIDRLLPEDMVTEVCNCLEESSKHWEISANIALKMGIKKSLDLTDELVKHLSEIRRQESRVVERFEGYLSNLV